MSRRIAEVCEGDKIEAPQSMELLNRHSNAARIANKAHML